MKTCYSLLLIFCLHSLNAQIIGGEAEYTIKLADDYLHFDSKLSFDYKKSIFFLNKVAIKNGSNWVAVESVIK